MRTALPSVLAIALVLPASATQEVDPLELVKQARKLNLEGKQQEALTLYRQALDRAPDSFDAHIGAGVALDLLGEYKQARQHFAKAIQVSPDATRNQALTAMAVSYAFERDSKSAS